MRIDSSGRVGIGRAPSISNSKLEVGGADNVSLINVEASGVTGGMGIGSTGLQFFHGSSAKMRIDSSGNLLVGKTSVDNSTTGIMAKAGGQLSAVVQDAAPLFANRTNTDGAVVLVRKDNSTVGSIGSVSGTSVYIDGGASRTGVEFGATGLSPRYNGATDDDQVNLGYSTNRFKDLYLSGGVYLGGTGSANYLDDYEEGTISSRSVLGITATTKTVTGSYTKIGRVVTEHMIVTISGKSGGSGNPYIPLSFASTGAQGTSIIQGGDVGKNTVVSATYFGIYGDSAQIYANSSSGNYISHGSWSNGTIGLTVIYETA